MERGLNACVECCDRHAQPGRVALYWDSKDGRSARITFAQLKERSARLANLLQARGIQPGDRIAGLLRRIPELLVVVLATWRVGAVYQPLFTAFGPNAIEYRLGSSEARLIFTDRQNRHKLAELAELSADRCRLRRRRGGGRDRERLRSGAAATAAYVRAGVERR